MKVSFWDRVLMLLYVVLCLLLLVNAALTPMGVDYIGSTVQALEEGAGKFAASVIEYGLLAIMILLSVYMLTMIFRSSGKKNVPNCVYVDSGDGGHVSISMAALEQMVRQAIEPAEGAKVVKVTISGDSDALKVGVDLAIGTQAHVPSVTMNMRQTVRKHIEESCGVAVHAVDINVATFSNGENAKPEKKSFFGGKKRENPLFVKRAEKPEEKPAEVPVAEAEEVFFEEEPAVAVTEEAVEESPAFEETTEAVSEEAAEEVVSIFEQDASEETDA